MTSRPRGLDDRRQGGVSVSGDSQAGGTAVAGGAACGLDFEQPASGTMLVRLSGRWRVGETLPNPVEVQRQVASISGVRRMVFDSQGVSDWDSALVAFLGKVLADNERQHIETDRTGLPGGAQRLLALASAVPARKDTGAA